MIYKTIGEEIRYQRKLKGWSQQQLAVRVHQNASIISRWECNVYAPGAYNRRLLEVVFFVNRGWLDYPHEKELSK